VKIRSNCTINKILLTLLGIAALGLVACAGQESAKPGVEEKSVGIDTAGTSTGADVTGKSAKVKPELTARARREQDHVVYLIRQKIERSWVRPAGWTKGMACMVHVRLAPSGEVLQVEIVHPSGSTTFDRSAQNAVYKASPLPLPEDKQLIENFREFELRFRPEGHT
jgi:TolA protein